jgi:hypothetical protein
MDMKQLVEGELEEETEYYPSAILFGTNPTCPELVSKVLAKVGSRDTAGGISG